LGYTKAEALSRLGKPSEHEGDGPGWSTWEFFPTHGGQSVASYAFMLHNGRVNFMFTTSSKERTGKNVGPGSRLVAVRRAYPSARCKTQTETMGGPRFIYCVLLSRYDGREVQTVFSTRNLAKPRRVYSVALEYPS
jgi:hypothetical protein